MTLAAQRLPSGTDIGALWLWVEANMADVQASRRACGTSAAADEERKQAEKPPCWRTGQMA